MTAEPTPIKPTPTAADLARDAVEQAILEDRQRMKVALRKTMLSHNVWVFINIINGKSPYGGR